MTELYPVEVTAPNLPVAGDRPVVFHGVNKSGSLAMANVMRDAYAAAGRDHEFLSHYHGRPRDRDEFDAALSTADRHSFFVAHYVYRRTALSPDALLVTQVRHPLPRTLSAYGWMRTKHARLNRTLDGFPTLPEWVAANKGKHHSQMAQFAFGHGSGFFEQVAATSPAEIYARAQANLSTDFAWVGLAERFEESIFALAHICGLPRVPQWKRDTRNLGRPTLAETPEKTIDLIQEVYHHEFKFYELVRDLFTERLRPIDFGCSLARYKRRCRGEYGEQLLATRREWRSVAALRGS